MACNRGEEPEQAELYNVEVGLLDSGDENPMRYLNLEHRDRTNVHEVIRYFAVNCTVTFHSLHD